MTIVLFLLHIRLCKILYVAITHGFIRQIPQVYYCLFHALNAFCMNLKEFSVKAIYMTLPECMTLPEIWPTTIFSVKLMHDCSTTHAGRVIFFGITKTRHLHSKAEKSRSLVENSLSVAPWWNVQWETDQDVSNDTMWVEPYETFTLAYMIDYPAFC